MDEKISIKAYKLYSDGLNYDEIGKELDIFSKEIVKSCVDKGREIIEKRELDKNDGYKDLTKDKTYLSFEDKNLYNNYHVKDVKVGDSVYIKAKSNGEEFEIVGFISRTDSYSITISSVKLQKYNLFDRIKNRNIAKEFIKEIKFIKI